MKKDCRVKPGNDVEQMSAKPVLAAVGETASGRRLQLRASYSNGQRNKQNGE
jgi:hypothetical protein